MHFQCIGTNFFSYKIHDLKVNGVLLVVKYNQLGNLHEINQNGTFPWALIFLFVSSQCVSYAIAAYVNL